MSPKEKSAENAMTMLVAPKEMPTSNVTCGTAVTRGRGSSSDGVVGGCDGGDVGGDGGDGGGVGGGGVGGVGGCAQTNGGDGACAGNGVGADADTDEMSLHVLSDVDVGGSSC